MNKMWTDEEFGSRDTYQKLIVAIMNEAKKEPFFQELVSFLKLYAKKYEVKK